jgi:hypothetical protein
MKLDSDYSENVMIRGLQEFMDASSTS